MSVGRQRVAARGQGTYRESPHPTGLFSRAVQFFAQIFCQQKNFEKMYKRNCGCFPNTKSQFGIASLQVFGARVSWLVLCARLALQTFALAAILEVLG